MGTLTLGDSAHRRSTLARIAGGIDAVRRGLPAPPLLRLHATVPPCDPWDTPLAIEGQPQCRWHDGPTDRCFVAFGSAAELRLDHVDRFSRAIRHCSRVDEQSTIVALDGEPPQDLPCWVGGFAFADRPATPTSAWADWPPGWLFAPRVLIYADGDRHGAVVNEPLDPEAAPEALLERGTRRLQAVVAAVAAAARRHTSDEPDTSVESHATVEARDRFVALVERARKATDHSALDKIVVARETLLPPSPGRRFDPEGTARRLRGLYPQCTTFSFDPGRGPVFVGASPETLLRLADGRLETAALAGTAPRSGDDVVDADAARALAADPKQRHEHRLVVDAIRQALAPACEDLRVDDAPRPRALPNVLHLETQICGRLSRPRHILELVDQLHPTPAVGGAPRAAACSWLEDHEQLDRGWYAGPLGWFDARGEGHFVVGLRSALMDGDGARAFVGAGITAASQPVAEWEETEAKLRAVASALVLQEQPR